MAPPTGVLNLDAATRLARVRSIVSREDHRWKREPDLAMRPEQLLEELRHALADMALEGVVMMTCMACGKHLKMEKSYVNPHAPIVCGPCSDVRYAKRVS